MNRPTPPPITIHEETYRGITFRINTRDGEEPWGIFGSLPPSLGHWERYCKLDEPTTPETMREAIDRAHARCPVFTGDLRYRRQIEADQKGR